MESMALNLFGDVYAGRRVLVTGHTGFKGSWLALWLRALGAQVTGLALDPDTQPSHWSLLGLGDDIADHRVDLRDAQAVCRILDTHRPEIVFHLAAQPLVRRSYRDPVGTFATNVMGLVNLFEAIRTCPSIRVLVNATTDKIYAEHTRPEGYHETDPVGGHDPYSSSKACAELVSDCYRKSYFNATDSMVRIATARAGNVIGGGDWAEDRLVPDLVRAAALNQSLRIRSPSAIRPWQHVLEPLSGYLRLGQQLWSSADFAGAWNFGPGASGEINVQQLTAKLGTHWRALQIELDQTAQPHEAAILRLNCDKAVRELAWRPVWSIDTALTRTADWYRGFHESGQVGSTGDLAAYIDDARRLGLEWTA
ncbi:CDP-glucose 4,6-dehydratase [Rhodanobacter sp. PCA2]|nr:CDP-glucose 4,6-dehydratase [Rhodanobacter sp. PCA2]